MKKIMALTLAGVMAFSLPVMAAESPTAAAVVSSSASTASSSSEAAYVDGISTAVVAAAAQEGKTVGEYLNNAVTEVSGLTEVTPIAQGGHVILNGAPSNVTFAVTKPAAATVTSAKAEAAALGGKVLNVVEVKSTVGSFATARVNFYLKGIKAGQNIKVYQLVNGVWTAVTVAEIREDHVVVDMTSLGSLLFVELPAAAE